MPKDEYGDKWACEPCIRGHRAMKCEHWDRLMVQVRKPGRPLTDCPHPKQHNCDCNSRTRRKKVRMTMIQREQECLCRAVPGPQTHRTLPQGWQAPDLIQSHFSPASGGTSQPSYPHYDQVRTQVGYPHAPRPDVPFQSHFDPPFAHTVLPNQFDTPAFPTATQQTFFTPSMLAVEEQHAKHTIPEHGEGSYALPDQPQTSCCSSEQSTKLKHARKHENRSVMSEMLSDSLQTTMYRIPADIATYENPMKPDPQAGIGQSNPNYMQTVPAYAESGVIGTAALPADTNERTGCIVATTHHCHCGTGCQCIACPVHPGNATTQAKVAEMHDLLDNEPYYTSTFETNPSWPSSQQPNESLPVGSYQVYEFPMLPDGEGLQGLRPQPDYGSLEAGQHWDSPAPIPQTQSSLRDSVSSVPGYPQSTAIMGVPNGNNGTTKATPSQNYLHFQYPLSYINEQ